MLVRYLPDADTVRNAGLILFQACQDMGNTRTFVHSGNNADGDFKASRDDNTGSNNRTNPNS